jgi:hypothetical protein
MSNFDQSGLRGDDASHLEKHESPEASPSDLVDIPAGYFPSTAEEKALNRGLNIKLDIFLLPLYADTRNCLICVD